MMHPQASTSRRRRGGEGMHPVLYILLRAATELGENRNMRMDTFLLAGSRSAWAKFLTIATLAIAPATPLRATTIIFTLPVAAQSVDGDLFEECDRAAAASEMRGAAAVDIATRFGSREIVLRRGDRSLTAAPGSNEFYENTPDLPPTPPASFELEQATTAVADPLDALFADDHVAPLPPPVDRADAKPVHLAPAAPSSESAAPPIAQQCLAVPYLCGDDKRLSRSTYGAYESEARWFDGFHPGPLETGDASDETGDVCVDPAVASLLSVDAYDAYAFQADDYDSYVSEYEAPREQPHVSKSGESYSDWYGEDYDPYLNGQIEATVADVEKRGDADVALAARCDDHRTTTEGLAEQVRLDFGDLIEIREKLELAAEVQWNLMRENPGYFARYGHLGYGDYEHAAYDYPQPAPEYDASQYDCFPLNTTASDDVIAPAWRQANQLLKGAIREATGHWYERLSLLEAGYDRLEQAAYFGQAEQGKPQAAPRSEYVTRGDDRPRQTATDYLASAPWRPTAKLPLIESRPTPSRVGHALNYAVQTVERWSERLVRAGKLVETTLRRVADAEPRSPRAAHRDGPRLEELLEF